MRNNYKKSQYNVNVNTNINYYENFEDLTNKYITKYRNKTFYEVINIIYDDNELKLNEELNLINSEEYIFLIHSLITIDYKNLNIKKNNNIRLKLFNKLKEHKIITMNDLLIFVNLTESLFINNLFFTEKDETYINPMFLYNILTSNENNNIIEEWKHKYLIYVLKIFKLFDAPILTEHCIYKYWANKYNFEQRRAYILNDLCQNYDDCGTIEKMGEGALYYYKYAIKNDEEKIKNGSFPYISNKLLLMYNNIFINENKKVLVHKNKNTKNISVVHAF